VTSHSREVTASRYSATVILPGYKSGKCDFVALQRDELQKVAKVILSRYGVARYKK